MRHATIACLLLALASSGCSSLVMEPDDSFGLKAAKFLPRACLAVATLGISESTYYRPEEARAELERTLESWVGARVDALVLSWGQPTSERRTGDGGRIVEYLWDREEHVPGTSRTVTNRTYVTDVYGNPTTQVATNTVYDAPQTLRWTVRRAFSVDASGTITGYTWKGH